MTMLPPDRSRRKAIKSSWKAALWLNTKRASRSTAKAIAQNKAAVIGLTTSVAAAGVGVHATVDANQAKNDVKGLTTRLATVEEQAAFDRVSVTNLRDSVARLDTKNAKQLKALAKQLTSTADQIHHLVATVAALPPAPSLAPLTARVADLAKTTKDAARKAELATVAAAEQHDPDARAAAADAFAHASAARAVAEDAQKKADAANAKAQAALDKPDPTPAPQVTIPPIPPFEFPRTVSWADVTTTYQAPPLSLTTQVDLPKGSYTASVHVDGQVVGETHWYAKLLRTGSSAHQWSMIGSGSTESLGGGMTVATGGGVTTFTLQLDAYAFGTSGDAVSFQNIKLVIEESS